MSVQITPEAVYCPDIGLVMLDALLALQDPTLRPPPASATGVFLVLEDPEGNLCWEMGEWSDGSGMFGEGWYLIGGLALADSDYTLRYWCHEPPLPERLKAVSA